MKYLRKLQVFVLVLGLFFVTNSCGDDPVSSGGEPPAIPDLSEVSPDLSFFQNNSAKIAKSADDAFVAASSIAVSYGGLIQGLSTVPNQMLESASGENRTFENGNWTWEYSYAYGGQSMTVRMTASEGDGQVNWAIYLTANTEQYSFEDFKYMDGFSRNDGSAGQWNIYSLEEQQNSEAVMTFDWERTSETESEVVMTFGSQQTQDVSTITFTKNEPEHSLTAVTGDSTIEIFWNSETKVGFYDNGEITACWDENFQDVTCSEAGF